MMLYIINGWTDSVGQWELEPYDNYKDARYEFDGYIEEYNAVEENNYKDYAVCDEGRFWIEEVELR